LNLIRKAKIQDVKTIYRLITDQAERGQILPRAMSELYTQLRDFIVSVSPETDTIEGCGALQVVWEDLAEVRSLAVATESQYKGLGTQLIEALMQEGKEMGVKRVFVLTYRPRLFERLGFVHMEKSELPHKIWADCIKCTKFPECDELALYKDFV
jgi:amino-acid N-acetyltransferase